MPGWETQKKFGYSFDVLIQAEEADCGLCCCAMVVNQLGQGKPTSTGLQGNLAKGAYNKSTKDRAGMVATPLAVMAQQTHSAGTIINSLSGVLSRYHIANTVHENDGQDMAAAIESASEAHPLILRVKWDGPGAHWVVIAKSSGKAQFVLDPYYGFRINSSTTRYTGTTATGVINGDWSPYWLQVD